MRNPTKLYINFHYDKFILNHFFSAGSFFSSTPHSNKPNKKYNFFYDFTLLAEGA